MHLTKHCARSGGGLFRSYILTISPTLYTRHYDIQTLMQLLGGVSLTLFHFLQCYLPYIRGSTTYRPLCSYWGGLLRSYILALLWFMGKYACP